MVWPLRGIWMNLKGKYKKKVFKGSTFRPYWANYFSKLISLSGFRGWIKSLRGRRHSAVIYIIQHLIINMGVQGAKPPEASGIWTLSSRGKLTEWKYRRFSLNCLKIQELQEVFIEIQDNFQSSQNTGGNCHFTGNTGITGLRATPEYGLTWNLAGPIPC